MKRLLDIILAIALCPIAVPIIMIAAVFICLESKGGAFFIQDRLGQNKYVFKCFKLRTMRTGTAQGGSHEIGQDTITGVGKFLRRTKIDELPQLLNVLLGSMSFVGPRPGLPMQYELTLVRDAHNVFQAIPGITGLAQVQGVDMSEPEKLAKIDAQYIATRNLRMDILLMFRTVGGAGKGDAAKGS